MLGVQEVIVVASRTPPRRRWSGQSKSGPGRLGVRAWVRRQGVYFWREMLLRINYCGWRIVEELGHGLPGEAGRLFSSVSDAPSLLEEAYGGLTRAAADVTDPAFAPSDLFGGQHSHSSLLQSFPY